MSRSFVRNSLALALCAPALSLGACRQGALPTPNVLDSSAVLASPPPEPAAPPDPAVAQVADEVLGAARHPDLKWPDVRDVAPTLKAVYDAEPDGLFWFAGAEPYPGTGTAIESLAVAAEHGLDPADYDAAALAKRWPALRAGNGTPAERARFDLGLTAGLARLVTAVHLGRVDPATLQWNYAAARRSFDPKQALLELRLGADLRRILAVLEPPFAHYGRARRTLANLRSVLANGEPPLVPEIRKPLKKVEPGKPWAGVPELVARLRAFGDLAATAGEPPTDAAGTPLYAGPLVDAVKSFQNRHGLESDGVIGAGTIKTLNVPLGHRVRQVELAMERMRWLPPMANEPTVFVNVALFRLWATDPSVEGEPLRMNVVVWKSLNHQTPIFIAQMAYVVFRPYWNPTHDILRKEILPRARKDRGYLAKESLEIVASGDDDAPALPATPENLDAVAAGRLTMRQRPGPSNSLGLAKFIFPNSDSIYMHGTPAQSLFSRARRDFSHGCIRLEDPMALALWVLRDQPDWTREKIEAAMKGERPTRVNLKKPLTVVLFYDTYHASSNGVVSFVDDIYGDDAMLDAALAKGYPYPVKS
jgi:murein L,D-transpeptidase YcbB/YkuD